MTTKLLQDEGAREPFRPKFVVDDVARVTRDDKNYSYKLVIYSYRHDPLAVERHEKAGYEIIYSTEHIQDDRKFTPDNNKQEALRPKPVLKTTKDGFQQVLMRISKVREAQNAEKSRKEQQELYLKKVKSVKKQGNSMVIDGGELDLSNKTEE